MSLKEWAIENGVLDAYNRYIDECAQIAQECVEEGYPAHGENYELSVEELQQHYPELFGED